MKIRSVIVSIFLALVIVSCDKESNEAVRIKVNHYLSPGSNGLMWDLVYNVQQGEILGTDTWHLFYDYIDRFEYEPGYIYELEVMKTHINNPPMDGPNAKYELKRIISKVKVQTDAQFEIMLAIKYSNGYEAFLEMKNSTDYYLCNKVKVDCGILYDQLTNYLSTQTAFNGVFKHIDKNTIQLIELKVVNRI